MPGSLPHFKFSFCSSQFFLSDPSTGWLDAVVKPFLFATGTNTFKTAEKMIPVFVKAHQLRIIKSEMG
jgi:hypothetical protein